MSGKLLKTKVTTTVVAKVLTTHDDKPFAAIIGSVIDTAGGGDIGIAPIITISGKHYLLPDTYTLKRIVSLNLDIEAAVKEMADQFKIEVQPEFNNRKKIIIYSPLYLLSFATVGPETIPELTVNYTRMIDADINKDTIGATEIIGDTSIYCVEETDNAKVIECQKMSNTRSGYYTDYVVDDISVLEFNI